VIFIQHFTGREDLHIPTLQQPVENMLKEGTAQRTPALTVQPVHALYTSQPSGACSRSAMQRSSHGSASTQPEVVILTVPSLGSGLSAGPGPVRKARTTCGSQASSSGVEAI
jgi:hypothetical protein